MQVTPETIESYFQEYQWSYTRSSETTWITGVRTSVSSFRIFIRVTEHWIYFVINPFVVAPKNEDDRLRLYYHILRLNLDMNMAKFGLDRDGDVFLAIELPTENFVYSHFSDALNGISHHAERLYSEVFNLAHNASLVQGSYDDELENRVRGDNDDDEYNESLMKSRDPEPSNEMPLDDFDLLEDLYSDDDDMQGPIIAGKEVRIVSDDDGGVRIEFQTAHDLEDDDDDDASEVGNLGTDNADETPNESEDDEAATDQSEDDR